MGQEGEKRASGGKKFSGGPFSKKGAVIEKPVDKANTPAERKSYKKREGWGGNWETKPLRQKVFE